VHGPSQLTFGCSTTQPDADEHAESEKQQCDAPQG
jgi:hypothetical protein